MLKYPVHEITSSLEWQPQRHQECDEPPPKRPCNREIAQEMDSRATETVIRAQNATDVLHTIDDDTRLSDFSSSDELSMGSLSGL